MNQAINPQCPLCGVAMKVKDITDSGQRRYEKSIMFCPSCGRNLKEAFKVYFAQRTSGKKKQLINTD